MCLLHLYKESVIVPINLLFLSQQVVDTSKLSLLFLPFFWGLVFIFNPFRGICLLWAKDFCVYVREREIERIVYSQDNITWYRFCIRNLFPIAKWGVFLYTNFKDCSQRIWRPSPGVLDQIDNNEIWGVLNVLLTSRYFFLCNKYCPLLFISEPFVYVVSNQKVYSMWRRVAVSSSRQKSSPVHYSLKEWIHICKQLLFLQSENIKNTKMGFHNKHENDQK